MYFDKSTKTELTHCRKCNTPINAHTAKDGSEPKKDDVSICSVCGEISKFDEELNLIPMSKEELTQFKHTDPSPYWELMKLSLRIKTKSIKK